MPKLVYTAAKGVVESNDASSGFQVNDVPIKPGISAAATYTGGLYTVVFTTAHDGAGDGGGENYEDKYLTITDRDGGVYAFWFRKASADSIPTAVDDLTKEEATVVDLGNNADKTQSQIGAALVTAINVTGAKSKLKFFAINSSGTVTIHVLQTGLMTYGTTATAVGGDITSITDNTAVLTSDGAGSNSQTKSTSRSIPAIPMVQQTVTVGAASDVAAVKSEIAIADGSAAGQEKFIRFAAPSAGQLVLTGNFVHGTTTGTKVTFTAAQGAAHGILFLWIGGAWMIINKLANMTVS